jgi:pentatricopeptide repeat protein
MLSRLVSRCTSKIWHVRLSTRRMNHSLGQCVVIPLSTQHTLLNTHSKAPVTSRVSRAQSTVTAKEVPTVSSPNTTPKQQDILILNKDLIFTDLRANHVDYQLDVLYACLKAGHIERARILYESLTKSYPDQKERLADVSIYNAFIEAHMKEDVRSRRWALYWLDKMRKQQIKPNLTTYVILIKGFLRSGSIDAAHLLLTEMLKEGYSITAFMLNRNIS